MNSIKPILIVMLTHHDRTVANAAEIFEKCKDTSAEYWGIKEEGIPKNEMISLFSRMKECGKTTVLEVVVYTESECIEGAKTAFECGADILMGTLFYDSVNSFCKKHSIKYMPFVGEVHDRPSVLNGSDTDIINEAKNLVQKGVSGFDLLGYRYIGNCDKLIKSFIKNINAPTCIAGSVDSFEKLDTVIHCRPWAFTIGGAFFDKKFGEDFKEQINTIIEYVGI